MIKKIILIFAMIFLNSCKKDYEINYKNSENRELPSAKAIFFKGTPVFELASAIKNDNLKKVYTILKSHKFNIDYKDNHNGYTVLMYATLYKKSSAIKILLENGSDPNLKDNTNKTNAFLFALQNTNKIGNECDTDILNLMIKYDANVNSLYKESNTLENPILNIACTQGCLNVVKILVDKGADINYDDKYGNSAILQALYQDNLDIAKYLIIDKKAKIPKPLFIRRAGETDSGEDEKVTLEDFLNEQNYNNNTSNFKLKKDLLNYLNQNQR
ncbi:ankyrin repeat domain-containing protein [Flavobacterium ajazii]|uniref:ankyrin repeat domain-containing protein n=1 Tax=Flavobacterium ajazii TaxID=2692318 RepID=UPI0013CFEAA3|nr:ankyrin repeat domain-containing protein [Flavobacterium ajazii]